MECGKVGCNQDREPEGPKIDPSKPSVKKTDSISKNIFCINAEKSINICGNIIQDAEISLSAQEGREIALCLQLCPNPGHTITYHGR